MASDSDQGGYYAAGVMPSDGVVASTPPGELEPLIGLSRIVRRLGCGFTDARKYMEMLHSAHRSVADNPA